MNSDVGAKTRACRPTDLRRLETDTYPRIIVSDEYDRFPECRRSFDSPRMATVERARIPDYIAVNRPPRPGIDNQREFASRYAGVGGGFEPGNRELEFSSVRCARRGPSSATVRLDNSSTDRQPHAHTRGLGREQRIKDAMTDRLLDSGARIPDRDLNAAFVVNLDSTSSTRGRSVTELMASAPFMVRFMMTCCNWTRSPSASGRSTGGVVWIGTSGSAARSPSGRAHPGSPR